jgi:hypothetical protein
MAATIDKLSNVMSNLGVSGSGQSTDGTPTTDPPYFPEERKGWHGYIEWDLHPERQKQAADILARHSFPHVILNL